MVNQTRCDHYGGCSTCLCDDNGYVECLFVGKWNIAKARCKFYEEAKKWAIYAVVPAKYFMQFPSRETSVISPETSIKISCDFDERGLAYDLIKQASMINVEVRKVE